jgi:hypothetical protein
MEPPGPVGVKPGHDRPEPVATPGRAGSRPSSPGSLSEETIECHITESLDLPGNSRILFAPVLAQPFGRGRLKAGEDSGLRVRLWSTARPPGYWSRRLQAEPGRMKVASPDSVTGQG